TDGSVESDGFDLSNGSIIANDTKRDQRSNLSQLPIILLHHLTTSETEEPEYAGLVQLRIECASDDDRVLPQALRLESAVGNCIAP
ncbi:hypothetical protein PENTCL1PPCAC_19472, partial [Pristionchus entomophagus]